MKLATESQTKEDVWVKPMEFTLAKGLIGIPECSEFELLVNTDELPFMWIRAKDQHELGFIVLEPSQFLIDYEIEISDDDIRNLGIEKAEDALVFTIATIRDGEDIESATVNLIGPILLNRNTMQGKQVIVSNHMKFSAKHPILSDSVNG
jgi:flagellar assembly factor FliW